MSGMHLLDTLSLSSSDITSILDEARLFLTPTGLRTSVPPSLLGRTVTLAFFESSTRTRLSFEAAAKRLGAVTLLFTPSGSSVEKGETLGETFATIEAMGVDAVVLRHGLNGIHHELSMSTSMSIINAGEGSRAHPTQALLDASALVERLPSRIRTAPLEGYRIVIVGDIRHSRVARSNVDVFVKLGAEVALCAPPTLAPDDVTMKDLRQFESIEDACRWAHVVNLLRIQRERITADIVPGIEEYRERYAMTTERAQRYPEIVVTHPGPVSLGVETDARVLTMPQSLVHRQVTHGVAVRMAILQRLLNPPTT